MQPVIKLYADTNAVKVVAFAIKLEEQFTVEELTLLVEKLRENEFFKSAFSNSRDQVEITFTINPDGIQQHQSMNGVLFEKKEGEEQQPSWTVSINKEFIVVNCSKYSRWKNIFPEAMIPIREIFQILGHKNIDNITLEYLDEFDILNTSVNWVSILFNKNSDYLLKSIFEYESFWHINHGYFTNIEGLLNPVLDNIYINYFVDENDGLKPKVNVRMQHKLDVDGKYDKDGLERYFDIIHIHSKSIFEKIIHNDILALFDRKDK